jgi:hypothetical protein
LNFHHLHGISESQQSRRARESAGRLISIIDRALQILEADDIDVTDDFGGDVHSVDDDTTRDVHSVDDDTTTVTDGQQQQQRQ